VPEASSTPPSSSAPHTIPPSEADILEAVTAAEEAIAKARRLLSKTVDLARSNQPAAGAKLVMPKLAALKHAVSEAAISARVVDALTTTAPFAKPDGKTRWQSVSYQAVHLVDQRGHRLATVDRIVGAGEWAGYRIRTDGNQARVLTNPDRDTAKRLLREAVDAQPKI